MNLLNLMKNREQVNYIYNFEEELKKYGLTQSTYEQVLQEISNKMSGISDMDW